MSRKILIDVRPEQIRVALLEKDDLAEIYVESAEHRRIAGNIYRGKVKNVLPGMQAAFVDIGEGKNAFLYTGDIHTDKEPCPPIQELLKTGQELTVQVAKEPVGTKGARITTQITLPGKYLVLMPAVNTVGISRRIEDETERQRLKSIAQAMKPESMGLIVRTAAFEKNAEDFATELNFLTNLWAKIEKGERKGKVPRPLHREESILYRTVRDLFTGDVDQLIVNGWEEYGKVLEWTDFLSPFLRERVQYFEPKRSLFATFEIEKQIERAVQRKIRLKSGGSLVMDPTEALTVIDVNTDKYVGRVNLEDTVFHTNLEAAEEIARQIRLRDIGGIIVIDFIDMEVGENRMQVLETLKTALKRDRAKTNVVGFTGLGLVEMTRKKI